MLALYWGIGASIVLRQQAEGWGTGVLRRLAQDLKSELSGVKGFSERNLKRMTQFYRAYPDLFEIGPQAVAQLSSGDEGLTKGPLPVARLLSAEEDALFQELRTLVGRIPWAHNMLLIQKVKDLTTRDWYMKQVLAEGWSRDILAQMIKSGAHKRHGKATTNFHELLPAPQSDLAQQALKLRCFVVIDLKVGAFKPDFAGKMNFYLNVVDDKLRHESDNPSIGLILCQDKKKILAEYALRGVDKPIGVSEYELTRALPESLKSSLPTIKDIEAELSRTKKEDER